MNEYEWHLLEDKNRVESLEIAGAEVRCGDRVRLRPRQGGDVFDVALAGRIATIEAIEQDYEGQFHLSVVVDEDPGRDMGMARQPGPSIFLRAQRSGTDGSGRRRCLGSGDAYANNSDRRHRQYFSGRRCVRRGSVAAAGKQEIAARRARDRFRNSRLRSGVRAAGWHGRDDSGGCLPARRKARDALRDRAGFGFARLAGRGIRAAGGWARNESGKRAAPGENAGRPAEENPVGWLASPNRSAATKEEWD